MAARVYFVHWQADECHIFYIIPTESHHIHLLLLQHILLYSHPPFPPI